MRFRLAFLLVAVALCSQAAEPPQTVISNRDIRVKLYLPNAETGFYKGARFDWSGMIDSVEVSGHRFYGPWFAKVDAAVRDVAYPGNEISVSPNTAAVGPAEEFQTPLGFDSAKAGDKFVKIGVGVLERFDDTPYAFSKNYKIVDHGTWSVKTSPRSVEITQKLSDASGYAYEYTKTIRVGADNAQLIIGHRLRNTGTRAIDSLLYNHNFTTFDGLPTGDVTIRAPYDLKPARDPDPKFAAVSGKELSYVKPLENEERLAAGLQGFGAATSDYDFRIENHKTGTGIRIQGDRPLQNASLWSIRSVLAVAPFIRIDVEPGKDFTWNYTYTYYLLAK